MSQLEERYGGHRRTSEDNISARQPLPLWGAVFMEVATIEWTREGRCDLTALMVSLPREHPWHATVSVSPLGKGVIQSSRGRGLQRPKATQNRKCKELTSSAEVLT